MATDQLRAERVPDQLLEVKVLDRTIAATKSEKLLGVLISQDMSWVPHFWGETWRTKGNHVGVIPDLLRRLGLLRHLGRVASRLQMSRFVPGLFGSKVCYALPLLSSVCGLEDFSCYAKNKISCPKEIVSKLQVLQNQAARLMRPDIHIPHLTPTSEVIDAAGLLSIHQQMALSIIKLALRVIRTGHPTHLANKFVIRSGTGRKTKRIVIKHQRLNISLEGFVHQASVLVNRLPEDIWHEMSPNGLKVKLKVWVRDHISVKP